MMLRIIVLLAIVSCNTHSYAMEDETTKQKPVSLEFINDTQCEIQKCSVTLELRNPYSKINSGYVYLEYQPDYFKDKKKVMLYKPEMLCVILSLAHVEYSFNIVSNGGFASTMDIKDLAVRWMKLELLNSANSQSYTFERNFSNNNADQRYHHAHMMMVHDGQGIDVVLHGE